MLFYVGQVFLAFVIALSLQIIKIKGISCAERLNESIEQTALGVYLNDVAHVSVFYLKKFTRQKHVVDVDTDSLKRYVPRDIGKSMLRVQKLEDTTFDKSSKKNSDVIYSKGLADQKVVFDGVKEIEPSKATQSPKRDISSVNEP